VGRLSEGTEGPRPIRGEKTRGKWRSNAIPVESCPDYCNSHIFSGCCFFATPLKNDFELKSVGMIRHSQYERKV
jgi:hypothetical protein